MVGVGHRTGLGVILGAYKRIRARGGKLGVVCPEGCPSRSIFRLTGLVKVLDLRDTADEAVKALASEVTQ
jgi:anti-anti-sigma factor